MAVNDASQTGGAPETWEVWVRHCACGRVHELHDDEADARRAAGPARCGNCGRTGSLLDRTVLDPPDLMIAVCPRCTTLVFDAGIVAAAGTAACPACGAAGMRPLRFQVPERLAGRPARPSLGDLLSAAQPPRPV